MSHRPAPPVVNDDPTMAGERARTGAGTMRRKRGDTHVGTIEEQYHVNFGVRGDMHLGTLLKKTGAASLTDLLRNHGK